MRRLFAALVAVLFVWPLAGTSFAGQFEIDDKMYSWRDVIYENVLDRTNQKAPRVLNKFSGKKVKIIVAPGWSKDSSHPVIWDLSSLEFKASIAERTSPVYTLSSVLVAPQKTTWGIVKLELHSVSYGSHPVAPLFNVFNRFVEAVEKQRKQGEVFFALKCLEMSGKLYLSNEFQKAKTELENANVHFIFAPDFAKTISCPE